MTRCQSLEREHFDGLMSFLDLVPTLYFIRASSALHTHLLKKKKAQTTPGVFYHHLVSSSEKFAVVIWK